jgi:hypothetical protein
VLQDATLQSIPSFSFFEAYMASPLPHSIFATFIVPPDIPEPDKLFRLAQSIHPHWHLRRVDRKGRPIIPDINLDESEEGNVYVCFRRREVKAVRKTRRMEITSVEKLTRLNIEFEIALELVDKLVEREEIKREICANDANIWGHRRCMIAVTNKFPNLRSPEDDKYLIDKEKIKRKPLGVDTNNILRIPRGGLPSAGALFSAGGLRTGLLHEEEQDLGQAIVHPRERYEQIQKLIEGDLHTKNEAMYGMEDHTDVRRLPLPLHHEILLNFLVLVNRCPSSSSTHLASAASRASAQPRPTRVSRHSSVCPSHPLFATASVVAGDDTSIAVSRRLPRLPSRHVHTPPRSPQRPPALPSSPTHPKESSSPHPYRSFLRFLMRGFWPLLRIARRAVERMRSLMQKGSGCKKQRRWTARGRLRSGGSSMEMGRG